MCTLVLCTMLCIDAHEILLHILGMHAHMCTNRNKWWLQVIGRHREVQRVCQILARRKKNNPILLGEPGVGKTAIAEGLALAIAHKVPVNGMPLPEFLMVLSP
jgi:DNA helicase TIP49 (TBP-interacting protein)